MDRDTRIEFKRNRTMKYFIDATNKIIQEKGINAINIRDIANTAGFSSATIYNYFDNLSHLIFLATFNQLEEYNKAVYRCILECKNSVEIYMRVCYVFSKYSYSKPEIYEILFFSHNDGKFDDYIEQYYKLFPDRLYENLPKFLEKMFKSNNLHQRSLSMLERCIEDGYLNKDDIGYFNDMALRINKTIIQDVKENIISSNEAIEITITYYYKLLFFYIKDEYKDMLNAIYKKIVNNI